MVVVFVVAMNRVDVVALNTTFALRLSKTRRTVGRTDSRLDGCSGIWRYVGVYGGICRFMEVHGGIWRYIGVYGGAWRYVRCVGGCGGGCGGGGVGGGGGELMPSELYHQGGMRI